MDVGSLDVVAAVTAAGGAIAVVVDRLDKRSIRSRLKQDAELMDVLPEGDLRNRMQVLVERDLTHLKYLESKPALWRRGTFFLNPAFTAVGVLSWLIFVTYIISQGG